MSVEPEQEFDCVECGRHIIVFASPWRDTQLCAICISTPGWFRDPRLREIIDPDHDGREYVPPVTPQ